MTHDLQNIRNLAEGLRQALAQCADEPAVDPVHDTRTGTRRLQATLESLLRNLPQGDDVAPLRAQAAATMRLLKKIRHAAGPVRDLDVHRRLLAKLIRRSLAPGSDQNGQSPSALPQPVLADNPDVLETPEAGLRRTAAERRADDLDAWLRHRRGELARELQAHAPAMMAKFNRRIATLDAALRTGRRRLRKKPPAMVALDSFARLATEMQLLDARNLHDFRKGAKKARYVAELAAHDDLHAQRVSGSLRKLQDEIGDWHDWLLLAEEAHTALSDAGMDLIALIETERERHFVAAMKTATKLRGRLMGEWQALARPARRPPPGPAPSGAG